MVLWEELLKCFPASTSSAIMSRINAETDCYHWLRRLIKGSPNKRKAINYELLSKAKEQFDGLSGRGFYRALQRAVSEVGAGDWSKGGRPSGTGPRHRKPNINISAAKTSAPD
jgi:hypothetical protein